MATNKNFIFYSNYCHHSKRLINRIQSTNLMNSINFICIDDPKINIPNFIQVVPSLYDPSNRRVYTDEDLFNWIESVLGGSVSQQQRDMNLPPEQQIGGMHMSQQGRGGGGMNMPQQGGGGSMNMLPQQSSTISMGDITGSDDISPFQRNEMLGSSASSYSFIDEQDNEGLNRNYAHLDDRENFIPKFTKANENNVLDNGGRGGGNGSVKESQVSSAYDRLLQERQNEMQNNMSNMRM